jgi:SAM-dependent methyltransferase
MISLVNLTRCPVCEIELDTGSLRPTIALRTPRGDQAWEKCPGCRSFFAAERYDLEEEVEHTRSRPWGIVESGTFLNEDKAPMFKAILRLLRDHAPKRCTLLDIGCSYGGFLERARKEGYQVRGFDIVPEAVQYVRNQGIACDCAKSIGDLDIPDGSQSVITVLDCNYYWPSQRKELRAIHSKLRPGGLLAMRVVDTSWAIQLGLWLRKGLPTAGQRLCEMAAYDHRVSIPVLSLLRVVQQQGFEIIHTSPRDAMPLRHNSYKIKTAYAIGQIAWRIFGYNLSPGFVFLARKRAP